MKPSISFCKRTGSTNVEAYTILDTSIYIVVKQMEKSVLSALERQTSAALLFII